MNAAAVARLEDRLARAGQLAAQQRDGLIGSRSATARKRELRRLMKDTHLGHIANVARMASDEVPELAQKFTLSTRTRSYLAFRTAARGMEAEAESRKELLVKHGLSETVLLDLNQALDEFDAMVDQGSQARVSHVGASFELDEVADEIVQIVRVMNGINRLRFANNGELLASWEAASDIFPTPRTSDTKTPPEVPPSTGGEVRPAA